jgi:hypothetical protein
MRLPQDAAVEELDGLLAKVMLVLGVCLRPR